MSWKRWVMVGMINSVVLWALSAAAGDLKITLPKRSHATPVQRLNQEGVEAIRKHHYEKAETLFYKAYLLDPDDPFTLNNLGYIAELQGEGDRAEAFYALAAQQASDAVVERASSPRVEGRPMKEALAVSDATLEINRDNLEAMRLLSKGHAPDADQYLKQILQKYPNNIFALNNMGVAKEMEGEPEAALRYYDEAARLHSEASAVIAAERSWRGKPATEMAAENARDLRRRLELEKENSAVRVAELNISGVAAINRNDLNAADQAFRKAYALDPNNAFAVNNIGYLAEIEGDRETAQFFYDKARTVAGANATVGLATRSSAEGSRLFQVAAQNDAKVEAKVLQERDARRARAEPILLQRRDNSVVTEPTTPPANRSSTPQGPPSR